MILFSKSTRPTGNISKINIDSEFMSKSPKKRNLESMNKAKQSKKFQQLDETIDQFVDACSALNNEFLTTNSNENENSTQLTLIPANIQPVSTLPLNNNYHYHRSLTQKLSPDLEDSNVRNGSLTLRNSTNSLPKNFRKLHLDLSPLKISSKFESVTLGNDTNIMNTYSPQIKLNKKDIESIARINSIIFSSESKFKFIDNNSPDNVGSLKQPRIEKAINQYYFRHSFKRKSKKNVNVKQGIQSLYDKSKVMQNTFSIQNQNNNSIENKKEFKFRITTNSTMGGVIFIFNQ